MVNIVVSNKKPKSRSLLGTRLVTPSISKPPGVIVERTQAGLTAARARGRKGGRPKALGKGKREVAIELYNQKKLTLNQIFLR
jgi:hypothetical protein